MNLGKKIVVWAFYSGLLIYVLWAVSAFRDQVLRAEVIAVLIIGMSFVSLQRRLRTVENRLASLEGALGNVSGQSDLARGTD